MSQHRVTPKAGWVSPATLPKGPNGRSLCRWCNQEVPKGRRSFCGEACVHEHRIRSDPGYVRRLVEDRDHGICAICGVDTEARYRDLGLRLTRVRSRLIAKIGVRDWDRAYRRLAVWERRVGYICGHQWEADHIIPVAEGGGECGLDNYRTLCRRCHQRVTAELRRRLSGKAITHEQSALF